MIKKIIASKLENLPTGHSNRIISMRPTMKTKQFVALFSVYVLPDSPRILQTKASSAQTYTT